MTTNINTDSLRGYAIALMISPFETVRGFLHVGSAYCVEGALCQLSGIGIWKPDETVSGLYDYVIETLSDEFLYTVCAPESVWEIVYGIEGNAAVEAAHTLVERYLSEALPDVEGYSSKGIAVHELNDNYNWSIQDIGYALFEVANRIDAERLSSDVLSYLNTPTKAPLGVVDGVCLY